MIVLTVPNNNPLPHAQLHIIKTVSLEVTSSTDMF